MIPKDQELRLREREIEYQREQRERELSLKEREIEYQREQRERELSLKERELNFQERQTWWARWSTPAIVAIVAGLIGYIGTLLTSIQNLKLEREKQDQNLKLERQKQEATLILEAIKTGGGNRQAAANLVFLADAGLIKSIKSEELTKLRAAAGGTGPALPSPRGLEFQRSPALTDELRSKLQGALNDYQDYLLAIGYDLGPEKEKVVVRVDESETLDNAYFDPTSQNVVIGAKLSRDPEYVISQYTLYVIKVNNTRVFSILEKDFQTHLSGFVQGMNDYMVCSFLKDPLVGKNYFKLIGAPESGSALRDLSRFRRLEDSITEPHERGEIWGSAFWDLRQKLGHEKADKLIFGGWKELEPPGKDSNKPGYYVEEIVRTASSLGMPLDEALAQHIFGRRNLR